MPRVKRSVHGRKKRRKVLEQAKGYWGLKHSSYRRAKEQVEKSLVYAYRDRKAKKRTFRRLWIIRINAAARENGLSYHQFVAGCRKANIELDPKVLAAAAGRGRRGSSPPSERPTSHGPRRVPRRLPSGGSATRATSGPCSARPTLSVPLSASRQVARIRPARRRCALRWEPSSAFRSGASNK